MLIIIFILSSIGIIAEEYKFVAPDYSVIEQNITDKKSEFYYPNLMKRYKNFDESLTTEHLKHLYYGYLFDKGYHPFTRSAHTGDLNTLISTPNLDNRGLKKLVNLTEKMFKENPFDLRAIYYMSSAYNRFEEEEKSRKIIKIFEGLVDAILSTGDGTSCESGFHVIWTGHQYFLMDIIGVSSKGQRLVEGEYAVCDHHNLVDNSHRNRKIALSTNKS